MNVVIGNYEITEGFIRKYESYMDSIEDFEYGTLYKVELILNETGIEVGVMDTIEEALDDDDGFVKHSESKVTFIMPITHLDEGVHEIEITMDYTLKGTKYGDYNWRCLKL